MQIETIHMKCQTLLSVKKYKFFKLSSAEYFTQSAISVKMIVTSLPVDVSKRLVDE